MRPAVVSRRPRIGVLRIGVLLVGLLLVAACAGGAGRPEVAAPAPAEARPTPLEAARAACQGEAPGACDALADYWGSCELVPDGRADDGRADALLLGAACEQRDDAAACQGVALMHKYGTAGARDDAAARRGFARVRELGDLNGFRGEPPSEDGRAALARAQESCAAGRARACSQLGWAAFSAVQQDKDAVAAYAWWRRGCELGSATGCRWAGHVAYTYPETHAAGDAEALLRRACAADNPGGCDELGRWLAQRGDAAAAAPLFIAACAGGSRDGCADAGAALAGGVGIGADRVGAAEAYLRACQAGEPSGCTGLAGLFTPGACTLGLADAPARLDEYARAALQAGCTKSGDAAQCAAIAGCGP